jgi:FG-GAP-like repeat
MSARSRTFAALAIVSLAARAGAQEFSTSVVHVADASQRLALRDVDGDGRRDLLTIGLSGVSLRMLPKEGAYPEAASGTFDWPSETVGWSLADLDGDGTTELVLIVDGTRVLSVHGESSGTFAAPRSVLTDTSGFLPRGIRRVNIVRDVDGDGHPDIVLPGASHFRIHLQRPGPAGPALPAGTTPAGSAAPATPAAPAATPTAPEAHGAPAAPAATDSRGAPSALAAPTDGWSAPLTVSFHSKVDLELGDPSRLDARFAQDIRIPWFSLQDVDGDGRTDLVSSTDEETLFHLADPDLPEAPSWRLDLGALAEEIPRPDGIDLDNLLANVDPQVNWKVADLDGKPPNDLVIQQGGKFSVYLGGSRGPKLDAPDQVLKASGNVLYFLLRDVDKDGRQDLQLLRAQTVSLADALRLLVVPGSLDFDIFTYRNEGGAFSRKPSTRATVSLRVPALLSLLSTVDEMKADYEKRNAVPAQAAALDADGVANDIVDLRGDSVAIWKDRAPTGMAQTIKQRLQSFDVDALLEDYAERKLDQLDDGGTLSIELEDIKELLVTPGWDLRQSVKDIEPDLSVPLPFSGDGATLRIEDLDGDHRSDVIVLGRDADKQQIVEFLRTR